MALKEVQQEKGPQQEKNSSETSQIVPFKPGEPFIRVGLGGTENWNRFVAMRAAAKIAGSEGPMKK
ncbi:Uncharacterised protein [Candidatus Burarchaeum australiense]|nr:Uncharacterised protein [Candidatus Burarchaeum australiense]